MNRISAVPEPRRQHRLVLLVQGSFVLALYAPTLRLGLLSDAWVILDQARAGFLASLTTPMGWHYIPLASASNALAWLIFGTDAAGYQAVTIALHLAVGHLTYRLGLLLLRDVAASVTASLLFLGSAAFYEVTLWPAVGHTYALAAVPFLMGLRKAVEMGRTQPQPGDRWRLAGWSLIATLCYTGMVTLVPLAAAVLLRGRFFGSAGRARPWRQPREWLSLGATLLPCAAALAVPAVAKTFLFPSEMSAATFFRFDWLRVYFLDRSLLSVLTLRASGDLLHGLVTLGTQVRGGPWLQVLVWAWLGLAGLVLVHSYRRSASGAHTLLQFWLLLQLGLSAATISIVSRHTYLAAVPAALLTASALRELGRRLAERRTRAPSALLSLAPLVLGATALLSGAWLDLRRGVEAGLQATAITRRAAVEIRNALDTHPGSATLTLVDLPYQVPGATDITAYAFANGTAEMVKIVSGRSDVTVQLRRSHAGQVNSANRSTRLAVDELSALASDPSRIVLVFDPLTGNPLASGPGLQVAPGGRPRTSQRR